MPESEQSTGVASAAVITVRIELTRDDLVALSLEYQQCGPNAEAYARTVRRYAWIAVAVAIGCFGGAIAFLAELIKPIVFELSVLLTFVLSIGGFFATWTAICYRRALSPAAQARQASVYAESVPASVALGEQHVIASAEEISYRGSQWSSIYKWSMFTHVLRLPSCIVLSQVTGGAILLPARCFDSRHAFDACFEQLTAFHAASGFAPAARVVSILATSDYHCPGCKYNLRSAPQASCPECGRAVVLEELLALTPGFAWARTPKWG
jgi:hypothetical protein